jgi:hypothetical protein
MTRHREMDGELWSGRVDAEDGERGRRWLWIPQALITRRVDLPTVYDHYVAGTLEQLQEQLADVDLGRLGDAHAGAHRVNHRVALLRVLVAADVEARGDLVHADGLVSDQRPKLRNAHLLGHRETTYLMSDTTY